MSDEEKNKLLSFVSPSVPFLLAHHETDCCVREGGSEQQISVCVSSAASPHTALFSNLLRLEKEKDNGGNDR